MKLLQLLFYYTKYISHILNYIRKGCGYSFKN